MSPRFSPTLPSCGGGAKKSGLGLLTSCLVSLTTGQRQARQADLLSRGVPPIVPRGLAYAPFASSPNALVWHQTQDAPLERAINARLCTYVLHLQGSQIVFDPCRTFLYTRAPRYLVVGVILVVASIAGSPPPVCISGMYFARLNLGSYTISDKLPVRIRDIIGQAKVVRPSIP